MAEDCGKCFSIQGFITVETREKTLQDVKIEEETLPDVETENESLPNVESED